MKPLFASLLLMAPLSAAHADTSKLHVERDVPNWPGRAYDIFLPSSYGEAPSVPLIVAIHGGGGNKRAQRKLTCPGGDLEDSGCLTFVADREGFAVAFPNGTGGRLFRNLRTWNAGGGRDGFECVSGRACRDGVDDVAYFQAMLDDVAATFQVDASAVYFTGMSNGAAMAHRLACELAGRTAGIAPVGGANQLTTLVPCSASTAVMQIHGDADPCWGYLGGDRSCVGGSPGSKSSVVETVNDWARRNGCQEMPEIERIPDSASDGTQTTARRYRGCAKPVVHLLVENGGHTWPGGYQYFRERRIGKMSRDFSASEMIVSFFSELRTAR